ncbi:MAG TPA: ABC transporter ATP-binding protein [Oscillospiraceae bacterium]|nr:ABC transporter ATP-binding protein [Oscillospiraceae bacterium]
MEQPKKSEGQQQMPSRGRGGPGMRMKFDKPKDAKKTFKRLMGYIFQQKRSLYLVLLLTLFSSAGGVAGTYMLKPIVKQLEIMLKGGDTAAGLSKISILLIILSVIYLLSAASQYLYSRIMLKVSHRTLFTLRSDLFGKLQELPINYFDNNTHGSIMSRFTNDVDSVREAVSQGIVQVITSSVTVVGTFIMMAILSPILLSFVLVMLMIMLLSVKLVGKKSSGFFRVQQQELGKVNGYIEEHIEGQKVVKVFCREDITKEQFKQINEQLRKSATNANTFASILMPIMGNLSYLNYAATATFGAALILKGISSLDIATLVSFLQYTRQFSHPITHVSQQFNNILAALAGAERIFAVLDEAAEVDEGKVSLVNVSQEEDGSLSECEKCTNHWGWKEPVGDDAFNLIPLRGDVRFSDVTFSYDGKVDVLKDVSLFAKPGEKIAFVGSTGAGKTTITNLINRFYDIHDGKITYDGIDIKSIKKDALRFSLVTVLQETHLFTGTVEENIRYGRLDATFEDVVAAAKLANAHSFITRLPKGYNTVLTGNGKSLSQGQRQLLSIARAAVANPPVLILDEATSSIDTRTEKLIEKGMDKLMEGRTVFVIAHRLSTIRNANAILVLDNGKIIERGNHEQLLAQKGKYYQFYTGYSKLD